MSDSLSRTSDKVIRYFFDYVIRHFKEPMLSAWGLACNIVGKPAKQLLYNCCTTMLERVARALHFYFSLAFLLDFVLSPIIL